MHMMNWLCVMAVVAPAAAFLSVDPTRCMLLTCWTAICC